MSQIQSFRQSGERYGTLRALAWLLNALGILLIVLSVLSLLAGIITFLVGLNGSGGNAAVGLVVLAWALGMFLSGVQCVAVGSFFRLAIHIEENTRATAQALDRLRIVQDGKPAVDPHSMFLS